ncbi:DUF4019 domain-containing protein [Massilia soli]|uniref:DUF4019 domain-containing protein n=1 Tax=Massilia soli TaxID=2792854 RepID=A0ABS7SQ90_9BURK|nr:DUF4019 domain-containing protein [Massilia soli]MBZ2207977.1 DUF4019 domain-containing protein [Massilia soli]
MRTIHAAILVASMSIVPVASAERASAVHKGQEAAVAWLDLLDSAQYGASWDQAAVQLQRAVPRQTWEARTRALRAPLGAVLARRLKLASYTETLPELVAGQTVVLEYETRFENKVSAVETVTPIKDAQGSWKVGAYSIR